MGTSRDVNVRLFAFANTRPGYQVIFSPEAPIIILKTKRSATPQHPCQQWEPLSSLVFAARPNATHAVYVADTTALTTVNGGGHSEEVFGPAVGPLLKRFGNAITRLNPHNATLVAAGVSAYFAVKYILIGEKTLGHRDRLVDRLILVCPASLAVLRSLTDALTKRPVESGYPLPHITVLLKGDALEQVTAWTAWLRSLKEDQKRIEDFSVSLDLSPSLFHAVAREAGVLKGDGTAVDVNRRFGTPRVYRVDFVLSKQTKSVEQVPRLSPLNTLGYDDDEVEEEEEEDDSTCSDSQDGMVDDCTEPNAVTKRDGSCSSRQEGEHHQHHRCHGDCGDSMCHGSDNGEDEGTTMVISGLNSCSSLCAPARVIVEGRILDITSGLVGTTEGCVKVVNLKELVSNNSKLQALVISAPRGASSAKRPPAVAISAALARDEAGRTMLRAEEVEMMTKSEVRSSMTVGASLEEIPVSFNVSAVQHSYGAVLIRGRKCALVRDLSAEEFSEILSIPHATHSSADETDKACAVRALCDGCGVSSDNFYLPSYLPPVVYYEKSDIDGGVRCVTIFTALAVSPPPRGVASDAMEDAPEPEEPYDWVSFSRAQAIVATDAERDALRDAKTHLERAWRAGLYSPFKGCGIFGDDVVPLAGGQACSTSAVSVAGLASSSAGQVSLQGLQLYVVFCPGDAHHELAPLLQQAFHTPEVVLSASSTSDLAVIEAAAVQAKRGGHNLVVYLSGDDDDIVGFCEEQLLYFTEEKGATAQCFTVLLPCVGQAILSIENTVEASTSWLEMLLAAVRVSDVLVMLEPLNSGSPAAAVAQICVSVNNDISVLYGLEGRQPLTVASLTEKSSAAITAGDDNPQLTVLKAHLPPGVPAAPAAVEYLTHADSLSCFTVAGRSRLLSLEGDVWLSTRPQAQAFVYLDVASQCIVVEEGVTWEGESHATRTSELTLALWAVPSAWPELEKQVRLMESQLQWNESRDGMDWGSAKDTLPPWE